ncbi:hypothetical protein [Haliangium sp.]
MSKGDPDPRGEELSTLARSLDTGRVRITARCFLVREPFEHYEIILRAPGETAIVDVPIHARDRLPDLIEQALQGFVASLRTRTPGADS